MTERLPEVREAAGRPGGVCLEVRRLDASLEPDFHRVHCEIFDAGWCKCVAWWVPTWDGWGEREGEENAALRQQLFARGEHDGYLLYRDGDPVGWCQAGRRDRLPKLVRQFALEPDADAWALTCFLIAPPLRRRGLAAFLLAEVLADLRRRGARRVEVFPKRGEGLGEKDLWNGPESVFRAAGFETAHDDPTRPVLRLLP